ncbi:MAG: septum formation inhibitor Maf [Selenomonadales bacterium]|nr:septum formation inhibitor Maf [Selenomonadales bacterium]
MIVLASASPRRRELLTQVGYQFKVVPSSVEEEMEDGAPIDIVKHNALIKAQDIAKSYPKDIVIGADTIVVVNGRIFGKPQDENDAEKMLAELSGSVHQVMTGIAVVQGERIHSEAVVTDVTMRNYDMDEIRAYIATGEPMDKAGAYGIQGIGALLVSHISGCYNNVVGLPIARVAEVLSTFGQSAWDKK